MQTKLIVVCNVSDLSLLRKGHRVCSKTPDLQIYMKTLSWILTHHRPFRIF